MSTLIWGASSLRLQFSYGTDASVSLGSISTAAGFPAEADPSTGGPSVEQPLVELSAMGHGRFPGSFRHVDTVLSRSLRYIGHEETRGEDVAELRIIQAEEATGLQVTSVFVARDGISGFRTWTEVTVAGSGSYMLDFVSTLATGAYLLLSGPTAQEHRWSTGVAEGTVFISVPASIVVARGGLDEAFAVLTDQRRAIRAVRAADRRLPVVFNDYMLS